MDNIPIDKRMLEQWLKCGFMDNGLFYKTEEGTPQGGIISELNGYDLAGLERRIREASHNKGWKVNFITKHDFVMGAQKKSLRTI